MSRAWLTQPVVRLPQLRSRLRLPFIIGVLAVSPSTALGQPKAVELFGTVGYLRYEQDTAFDGGAVVLGGTAVLPITHHFAVEGSAQSSNIQFEDRFKVRPSYMSRITMISVAPVLRLGSDRVYGFAGFGIAAAVAGRYGGGFFQGRGGVVVSLTRHLVLRGDFMIGQLQNRATSANIGVGYRF